METILRNFNRWLEKSCPGVADALRQTELRSILIGVSGAIASEIRLLMLVLLIVVATDSHPCLDGALPQGIGCEWRYSRA